MVKDTQNNLYYFIISFSKENKSTQVTAKNEIDASCKRTPPRGGGDSLIWAIYVCVAPKGMAFQSF